MRKDNQTDRIKIPAEGSLMKRLLSAVFIILFLFQYGHSCSFSLNDFVSIWDCVQGTAPYISCKEIYPLSSTPF